MAYVPAKRRRRGPSDKNNELSKDVAEAVDRRYPLADPPRHIVDVLEGAADECLYCRAKVGPDNIDELVPPRHGGTMRPCNRVGCCGSCNSSKGDKTGVDF
jgi:5-methylcytosine-specific restriction endonuclease McrA